MSGFSWIEYLSLMFAFGIGAVAPGPDFAMVLRQSIAHGRGAALFTSAGIASAIFVHGTYTILGVGLVVSQSLLLFSFLKYAGVAYLLWLGVSALRAPAPKAPNDIDAPTRQSMGPAKAFSIGFLTNLLNPKAVLFFLALFTSLVSASTSVGAKSFYVASMAVLLCSWFMLVSVFFTTKPVRSAFYRMGQWFNRATGAALIFLAIRVAFVRQH